MTPGMLPLVVSCHFEVLWKTFSDHLSGYRQPLVLLFVLYTEISYPALHKRRGVIKRQVHVCVVYYKYYKTDKNYAYLY